MKILIASDSYIFQTSGAANVVIALADGLRQRGHDVKVLALANGKESYKQGNDYFIRSVPAFLYPDVRVSFARHDPLLDELAGWKPDLIHLHTEGSIARMARYIAAKSQAPIVMTAHTDYAYYVFGRFHTALPVRAMMYVLGKQVYHHVDTVIAPSEKACAFSQLQAVSDRVTVVPNGIKLERYQKHSSPEEKAELYQRWGLKDNGCTLAMITRVSKEKNILEILRFFPALLREVPQAQLIIVGDGPDRPRLEQYCAQNQLDPYVRFTGRIPPEDVYRYYDLGNVFVSASTFEVHSMSYLEAIANGLPLVCREDASLRGVLDNGEDGFTYRTEQEFVDAVVKILQDQPLQKRMRENARRKAEEYSDQRFVERSIALYEKVLSRHRPALEDGRQYAARN